MRKIIFTIIVGGFLMVSQSFVLPKQLLTPSSENLPKIENSYIDGNCDCHLYVDESVGFWYLKCRNSCSEMVLATCTYKLHYADGTTQTHTVSNHIRAYSETVITNGTSSNVVCETISVSCKIVE
ncbi:MAG: hypothetical protein IJT51_08810 [Bacteroidales bacterium]|nr:hypothetical protein [Bacteroidales bacterium]